MEERKQIIFFPNQVTTNNSHAGSLTRLDYNAKLRIKDLEEDIHIRDLCCTAYEFPEATDAKYCVPVDVRMIQVVPTALTPQLGIYKKDINTGLATTIVTNVGGAPMIKLGDPVNRGRRMENLV